MKGTSPVHIKICMARGGSLGFRGVKATFIILGADQFIFIFLGGFKSNARIFRWAQSFLFTFRGVMNELAETV